MTTESEARNRAEDGGDSPPPPSSNRVAPPEATAVVIAVSALESECSVGKDGDAKASGADVARGRKVFFDVGGMDDGRDRETEKVCRICHLSPERTVEEGSELIQLGCGCKNELGTAHRHCAETWFRLKGNRRCEICGVNAKNITGKDDGSFMEEWHDSRVPSSSGYRNSSERVGCWRGQPFCNFLIACLVMAFILPWFFRVNMF